MTNSRRRGGVGQEHIGVLKEKERVETLDGPGEGLVSGEGRVMGSQGK